MNKSVFLILLMAAPLLAQTRQLDLNPGLAGSIPESISSLETHPTSALRANCSSLMRDKRTGLKGCLADSWT